MPSQVANWSSQLKQNTKKGHSAIRLSPCLEDTSVTHLDKWYLAIEKVYMENIVNWSKDQSNSNKMIYNIEIKSLSEGCLCILSRQMY